MTLHKLKMNMKHQNHIAGTSVIQNLFVSTWHLYAKHCQISVADKKLEQITQGEEWRNEAIRGKLTALVQKQKKYNIWMTGVPKGGKIHVEQWQYSVIGRGKS